MVTGCVSGLVVLDYDTETPAELYDTYSVKTAKGIHFYFQATKSYPTKAGLAAHLDIRGEGGYVVAASSIHHTGVQYQVAHNGTPAPFPSVLLRADGEEYIVQGRRHQRMGELVGRWYKLGYAPDKILELAREWNSELFLPSLPNREVERWVTDIGKKESQRIQVIEAVPVPAHEPSPLLTTAEFTALYGQVEEQGWLVEDWLPSRSVGIVSALPGSYKTWILLELALAVAAGRPMFGMFPAPATGPVLIYQQEDDFGLLAGRLAQVIGSAPLTEALEDDEPRWTVGLLPENIPIHWSTSRSLRSGNRQSMVDLYHAVDRIRPALIIIDPLNTFISMQDYAATSSAELMVLKLLRDKFGVCTMIAHHDTKHSKESGRQSMYGSVFLDAWVETGWHISRSNEDVPVVVIKRHTKGGAPQRPVAVEFTIDANGYATRIIGNG